MSPKEELWRRRTSSFVFSWVILLLSGVDWKWLNLRPVFTKQVDLMLLTPLKKHMFGLCVNGSYQGGRVSAIFFIKSGYGFLYSPKISLAVCLTGTGSSIQEDSQRGWLILKALSCQEDLYSADRGNVFCQAFEIQMMSSTLCPTDGFESFHKRRATEMGPTQAVGEKKHKINFLPKIDDGFELKRRK